MTDIAINEFNVFANKYELIFTKDTWTGDWESENAIFLISAEYIPNSRTKVNINYDTCPSGSSDFNNWITKWGFKAEWMNAAVMYIYKTTMTDIAIQAARPVFKWMELHQYKDMYYDMYDVVHYVHHNLINITGVVKPKIIRKWATETLALLNLPLLGKRRILHVLLEKCPDNESSVPSFIRDAFGEDLPFTGCHLVFVLSKEN